MKPLAVTGLLVALSVSACTASGGRDTATPPVPQGPSDIQAEVVERHARQFDEDVPERPAGSQEEFAASAYLIAHLQQAGYVARLEPVPVADLVRSTDVIAVPPGTQDPVAVVAIGYDTGADDGGDNSHGPALGLFLELARASLVADPDSSIWFAALGAQQVPGEGAFSGSKVLLRYLTEEGVDPLIILLQPADAPLVVAGPPAVVGGFMGRTADATERADAEEFLGRDYDDLMVLRGEVNSASDDLLGLLRELDG